MDDLDTIEEDLKESTESDRRQKPHKESGRSVFKLKDLMIEKSKEKGAEISENQTDKHSH